MRGGNGNLTTKLEVINKSSTLNILGEIIPVESYISPYWNDYLDNKSLDRNGLTGTYSYKKLKIINATNYTCTDKFLKNVTVFDGIYLIPQHIPMLNQFQDLKLIFNISGAMETEFQKYYNFTFPINSSDISTYPIFLKPIDNASDGFVFIEENPKFNPDIQELPTLEKDANYSEMYMWSLAVRQAFYNLRMKAWYQAYPNCKGLIWYDYDKHSFNTDIKGTYLPVIFINGSEGRKIMDNIDSSTIDFFINQQWNTLVVSYNVIGEIHGIDDSKTVLIECLYDSVWCQGTVDSGVGVGILVSLAKYFKELEKDGIRPETNVKFVAFGGEEYGLIGALYYEIRHKDEHITLVIDLNQLGYNQTDPPSTLNIATNRLDHISILQQIINRSGNANKIGNNTNVSIIWTPVGSLSDEFVFAAAKWLRPIMRSDLTTVMFLKDLGWYRHHRDGMNHTEGDAMKYVDWAEVNLTADMILNVTYGLMFMQWDLIGFIPFFFALIIIIIIAIILWKIDYVKGVSKKK